MRWLAVLSVVLVLLSQQPLLATPATDASVTSSSVVVSLPVVVDTYVDASLPDATFGAHKSVYVDGRPEKVAYLRFDATGLEGLTVERVRLRLYQKDVSSSGGDVYGVSGTTWPENLRWNERPVIDGPLLGSFGPVARGQWYEIDLVDLSITGDTISIAITSANTDGVVWASRESGRPPALVLETTTTTTTTTAPTTTTTAETTTTTAPTTTTTTTAETTTTTAPTTTTTTAAVGSLSTVADAAVGSSDPTAYASNRRAAVTSGGRTLVVHGRHKNGVQLAWRDPGGSWRTSSQGRVADGRLVSETSTGDWASSVAVGRDQYGQEIAFVTWSPLSLSSSRPLQVAVLTDLDSAAGPNVGPITTMDGIEHNSARADVAFDPGTGGAIVTWTRKAATSSYELVVAPVLRQADGTVSVGDRIVLFASAASDRTATALVTSSGDHRVVARATSGRLYVFGHDGSAPLDQWWKSVRGGAVAANGRPSAIITSDGSIAAAIDDAIGGVSVYLFSATGTSSTQIIHSADLRQPSLTLGPGGDVILVAIRSSDGFVVSQTWNGSAWEALRVEIGQEGGGDHDWPSVLRQSTSRLGILVRGPRSSVDRSTVLWFERPTQ